MATKVQKDKNMEFFAEYEAAQKIIDDFEAHRDDMIDKLNAYHIRFTDEEVAGVKDTVNKWLDDMSYPAKLLVIIKQSLDLDGYKWSSDVVDPPCSDDFANAIGYVADDEKDFDLLYTSIYKYVCTKADGLIDENKLQILENRLMPKPNTATTATKSGADGDKKRFTFLVDGVECEGLIDINNIVSVSGRKKGEFGLQIADARNVKYDSKDKKKILADIDKAAAEHVAKLGITYNSLA